MEAFYVSIIFLGIILVVAALFFIIMDKVNGKDFFKEFDRKKDEMFNLIQDSEEMVQELNKMSDYVVTVIDEKNQEFFNKTANHKVQEPLIVIENVKEETKELPAQAQEEQILLETQKNPRHKMLSEDTVVKNEDLINNKCDVKQIEDAEPQKGAVLYNTKDAVLKYKNSGLQNKGVVAQNEDIGLQMGSVVYEPQKPEKLIKDNSDQNGIQKNSELAENKSMDSGVIDDRYLTVANIVEAQKSPDIPYNYGKDTENHEMENPRKPKLTLSGKRGEVLQMIEHGLTDEEISEKLRVGKGEVSLIRGLSK
jgi:hypothetical protein